MKKLAQVQFLSTTGPCCSIEFIKSFSFWVNLVTYNIRIYKYICICFYKLSCIHSFFFVYFNCNDFCALHAKNFEIWKYIWLNWWVDCFIALDPSGEVIFLGVHSQSIFASMQYFLWSPCVLLIAELISLDTSGKPTLGFFLKITSPFWIILLISLDELNSIDWLLKSWWWIFLK